MTGLPGKYGIVARHAGVPRPDHRMAGGSCELLRASPKPAAQAVQEQSSVSMPEPPRGGSLPLPKRQVVDLSFEPKRFNRQQGIPGAIDCSTPS